MSTNSNPGLAMLATLALLAGCAHGPAPAATARVTLTPLVEGVFIHISWRSLPGVGPYPSNGLLVCEGGDGLLVDTAWTNEQTAQLLDQAASRGCPVRSLVVTHFHDDRLGGLSEVLRRGIATYASGETVKRAGVAGWSPGSVGAPDQVRAGSIAAEVFFPGAAHTADNVVVWLPRQRVLFGGCMLRAADAAALGNLADADVAAWPASARRVIERYGEARIVVPGHGAAGGPELLSHTLSLAEAAQPGAK